MSSGGGASSPPPKGSCPRGGGAEARRMAHPTGALGELAAGAGRVGDALDLRVRRAGPPPTLHPPTPHHRPPARGSAVRTWRAGTGADWQGAERRAGGREAVGPGSRGGA